MLTFIETAPFARWMLALKDTQGRARIVAHIQKVRLTGNFGDSKSVGGHVSELRFVFGPGYCVYFTRCGNEIVILLGAGGKDSQSRDIAAAQTLAKEFHHD